MLTRLVRPSEAAQAYEFALVRTENESERTFLAGRLDESGGTPGRNRNK
ncbi:MAG: hypothetical protein JWQ70_2169 [Aeromicrobium sp.]|nr:hypothetical protein [Aeromicrobium sp.]